MSLKVRIFADGADKSSMLAKNQDPLVKGFTTNPTLMRKSGITDYQAFAREILAVIRDKPISFEVFADDFNEMERQACEIATWGKNVNVKIPVTNTKGEFSGDLIRALVGQKVALNVTALMTPAQVREVVKAIRGTQGSFISVFAGRIADTGRDPVPLMKESLQIMKAEPNTSLIWASPRELLNIVQADEIGCHVITVTDDVLKKVKLIGKSLDEYSLDTVKMFYQDAQSAGFKL